MIAVITHNYPDADNPVAGLFVRDHKAILEADTGEEVRLLHYPFGEYPMTESIKNPLKWPKFIHYFLQTPRRIRQDIGKCTVDNNGVRPTILAHWFFPSGVFATRFFDNVDVICHGTDLYQLQKHPWIARIYASCARRVLCWRCVSTDLKRILLEIYPFLDKSRILVRPMPIDPIFRDSGKKRDPKLLISVGALIPRKQFDMAIREVAKIARLKLEIYGAGPEKERLARIIDELNVGDRIKLMGQARRGKLAMRYNQASLCIMLSYNEGFGLALKEAQACGCKTLAFMGDGMVDTRPDFPIDRSDSVAEKIKAALTKPEKRHPYYQK